MKRQARNLRRLAEQLGYKVEETKLSHLRCTHPRTGALVHISTRDGPNCGLRNTEATLRRGARGRKSWTRAG